MLRSIEGNSNELKSESQHVTRRNRSIDFHWGVDKALVETAKINHAEITSEMIQTHHTSKPDSQLHAIWRSLASSPFEHPAWLMNWWRAYAGADDQLWLQVFHDDRGQVTAISPLYRRGGRFGLLGDGEVCSDHSSLVVGDEMQTVAAVEHLISDPEFRQTVLESIDVNSQTQRFV